MFEDEHRESTKRPTRLDYVMSDAALLLPPAATPLTGIDFAKRLPCGEVGGWRVESAHSEKPILITLSNWLKDVRMPEFGLNSVSVAVLYINK